MKWKDGRTTEITGFLSPAMNSLKQRESKGRTRGRSVFKGFFCAVIAENYRYQVATFDALTTSGL